jgi:uncharacterized protein GlcG (DUF336 family)
MKIRLGVIAFALGSVPLVAAENCKDLPTASQLRQYLNNLANASPVVAGPNPNLIGGLFNGSRMWAAVVNRDGEVCAYNTSTTDPSQVWPGSQAIAKAKAYTANAFSLDVLALSTARLYTFAQPGRSLWSLGQSNLFEPKYLAPPSGQEGGDRHIAGGLIFFGGGLPIYRNGKIIGGLGVSGDTSCADHEVAKRVRDLAGLNPPTGPLSDDITYTVPDGASAFTHPKCINTARNGVALAGTEQPAVGY